MPMTDKKQHKPPPPLPPDEETAEDGASDGLLDLDDGPQIDNQHLEIR